MDTNLMESTIDSLRENYKISVDKSNEFKTKHPKKAEELFKNFHIRTTTKYWRLVCTHKKCSRLAMRTIKIDKEKDFENAFEKGLKVLRDADKFDGISKEEAFEKYGIEIYPSGKRKSQTEYNIQAKFINYLLENDFKLATSEFAITRGENSRMDIIAEKDGNLWIFEVKDKDYKTDALKQVNGYKQLLEANKKVIRDILLPVIPDLKEDFTIHTALVYTGNERSQIGIDAAWRYENGTFIKVE